MNIIILLNELVWNGTEENSLLLHVKGQLTVMPSEQY